jgi:hypothetical protein
VTGTEPNSELHVSLREHLEKVAELERMFQEERDRRYSEVNIEREKALKIKETADLAALQLAREIQTYKDEKANELREQISSERGAYATKEDIANLGEKVETLVKPLQNWQSRATGAALVMMLAAGTIGAVIVKLFGG